MNEVCIKHTKYVLKWNLRVMFAYESIKGEQFKPDKLINLYLLYYCVVLANNSSFSLTFGDFIDAVDEDNNIATVISDWLSKDMELRKIITPDVDTDKVEKKK